MIRSVWIVLALFIAAPAHAHEVRPAYLELTETEPGRFDIVWKQPITDGRRLVIDPVLPEACEPAGGETVTRGGGTLIKRWSVRCDLSAAEIRIDGLDRTLTDVFARVSFADGDERTALLKPASPTLNLTEEETSGSLAREYLKIGVDHIIFGPDHLLFVLGLVFLVSGWQIIGVATAFTVAHSLTLALTALGGLTLPQRPVEILIAASIVLLAVEVMRKRAGNPSLAVTRPWLIAFVIGLVHGFGFAGALAEIGLPRGQELLALLLFNLGVEIGQIAFIVAVLALLWLITRASKAARPSAELAATYAIGAIGAFWMIERLSQFMA